MHTRPDRTRPTGVRFAADAREAAATALLGPVRPRRRLPRRSPTPCRPMRHLRPRDRVVRAALRGRHRAVRARRRHGGGMKDFKPIARRPRSSTDQVATLVATRLPGARRPVGRGVRRRSSRRCATARPATAFVARGQARAHPRRRHDRARRAARKDLLLDARPRGPRALHGDRRASSYPAGQRLPADRGSTQGGATRSVTPDDALGDDQSTAGRSPLTLDEGIALVTHEPEAVAKNERVSLLGSRCGDRRVTALSGSPRQTGRSIGWCWAGNPHTWLGSALVAQGAESIGPGLS